MITSDARFVDRDFPSKYSSVGRVAAVNEPLDIEVAPVRTFVGETKSVLFEYDLSDYSLICDGEFGQREDYTMYTPFTQWDVDILDNGSVPVDLDWQRFKGLRWEFFCDIMQRIKTK